MEKLVIIGSGPAGYTAGIYAARAGLSPVIYEGLQPGGQLTTTTQVENFPGFPDGVDARELMDAMRAQCLRFGAEIRPQSVERLHLNHSPFTLCLDDGSQTQSQALIVATGASARYLGLPDEQRFLGQGVSACATCDGFFYRGRRVAVVGGGDSACAEAEYLAGLASRVFLIVRKPFLRASLAMQQRVLHNPKIEVLFETNATGLYGSEQEGVEGAHLVWRRGERDERRWDLPISGFFLAIGHTPNSSLVAPWCQLDAEGYIQTEPGGTRTNVPGVFAAGDVADPHYRQAITAAASGCKAALEAERWIASQI